MSKQKISLEEAKQVIFEHLDKKMHCRIFHKELMLMPYRDIVFYVIELIHDHTIPELSFHDIMGNLLKPDGRGEPKDFAEAIQLHQEAIIMEFQQLRREEEQFYLSWLKSDERGVPQDFTEALQWYLEPAKNGEPDAQYKMGEMYFWGCGVPQDNVMAAYWYKKGADSGDARAQADYGWLFLRGRGVEQDDAQAIYWLQKAADQGNPSAQYILYEAFYRIEDTNTKN